MSSVASGSSGPGSSGPIAGVGAALPHDSARGHVTGSAQYVDDLRLPEGCLHLAVGMAPKIGRLRALDLSAVCGAEGVVDVYTADDIPGHRDIGPVFPGDPLLVEDSIAFHGQAVFVVAARSLRAARQAVRRARYDIVEHTALQLHAEQAHAAQDYVRPLHRMQCGDSAAALSQAPLQLQGQLSIGGQEHFYLEGQAALSTPDEDGNMLLYSSTQHPSEVQKLVAEVLDWPMHRVTVHTRRMGGGFGGKETQAAPWACLCALVSYKTGQPASLRLRRSEDFVLTGKRHPFESDYRVGFDETGRLLAVEHELSGLCGHSPDLSDAIVDRAMFHANNAYFCPNVRITGHRCRTHMVSHTAFRGFGGPQGVLCAEAMLDDVARAVGRDPLAVRLDNLYGVHGHHTAYGQEVEDVPLAALMRELAESTDYDARRRDIVQANATSPVLKRGLALTPVQFGISFTVGHLNQAGALIHIYTDGSIQVNHGGTEMGQGLHRKISQIVAQALGVAVERVLVSATRTDKVPNTSPTAASSGTDLNGMAARNAALTLRKRLMDFAQERYGLHAELRDDALHVGERVVPFGELAEAAYRQRIALSATGYYRTPKIHYDRASASGRPFFYYACGAALSEVIVDTRTGESKLLRVDILHDAGASINPALDIGQIEGGFAQGMGWLTTEELRWHDNGALASAGPATYKIPTAGDLPALSVRLWEGSNAEETIHRSRAVGEPPLMLGISVWCALRDAISSLSDYQCSPALAAPATAEAILDAISKLPQSTANNSTAQDPR